MQINEENVIDKDDLQVEYELQVEDELEDLDISWLEEFEKIDNEYNLYYSEDLTFIKIHFIYINNNNEIEKISEKKIFLKNNGCLQKEELLSIIKNNSFLNEIKYSLLSILKYNINLEPINLKTFLKNNNADIGANFLTSIRNLDTIKFDKSITLFHDINELLIIFHKKRVNNYTKKRSTVSKKMTRKRT